MTATTAVDELIRNYKLAVITRLIRCRYDSGASQASKSIAIADEEQAEAALKALIISAS